MIYLYPANKMEHLLALYQKICQSSPLFHPFSQEVILVHNQGMQHWLNLALAKQTGVSMNQAFALPSQYFWQLVHQLVAADELAEQAPYSREVLVWRIDALLASKDVITDTDFATVTHYWQQAPIVQQPNKRFELARQVADLFEQYLVFRPNWLDAWQHKQTVDFTTDAAASLDAIQTWQAKLWRLLTAHVAYNPKQLVEQAIANLTKQTIKLPERIACFGINNLPPLWLNLLQALSEHCQVHFFHLNPCADYWGDVLTSKQASKQISQWAELSGLVGNPLLANWGQQGREFLHLIQQFSHLEIAAFDQVDRADANTSLTRLAKVQQDILTLSDARLAATAYEDDSITITSAHSPLREVQGLHDWLLHQFNQNSELTPKDVLVMCPQVEQYAPYVEAVFAKGWRDLADNVPPLPCSIADRISLDSNVLVSAFFELLTLPDSRFSVSQLVSWLRLTPLQSQLEITPEQVEQLSLWLQQVSVHWGINEQHKSGFIGAQATAQFTWQQGLSRLLLGYAYGEQTLYQGQLINPLLEGEQSLLLGKLIYLVEQLVHFRDHMLTPRSATQWQQLLAQLVTTIFDEQDETVLLLQQALAEFSQVCEQASYVEAIPLTVVKNYLQQQFSQPDTKQQFMVGQITFCSMLPMRSIPFKVIAVLGLNDGDFPRQRQNTSFDLMQMTPARLGDRSRRGDDRYLFLEALISAREKLYLSYQGKSVRTNSERQPSLVLQELIHYLEQGFYATSAQQTQVHQLPLQAFSELNYQGQYPSFDANWLKLAQDKPSDEDVLSIAITANEPQTVIELTSHDLVRFFNHPTKVLLQSQLGVDFALAPTPLVSDTEPFTEDHLAVYQFRQNCLAQCLAVAPSQLPELLAEQMAQAKASGIFPELPNTEPHLLQWQQTMVDFAEQLKLQGIGEVEHTELVLELSYQQQTFELTVPIYFAEQRLLSYRPSSVKFSDRFHCYLQALALHSYQQQQAMSRMPDEINQTLMQISQADSWYFGTKAQQMMQLNIQLSALDPQHWQTLLALWLQGQHQPLPITGELCEAWYNAQQKGKRKPVQQVLSEYWHGSNDDGFCQEPYLHYAQLSTTPIAQILDLITDLYQPVLTHVKQG